LVPTVDDFRKPTGSGPRGGTRKTDAKTAMHNFVILNATDAVGHAKLSTVKPNGGTAVMTNRDTKFGNCMTMSRHAPSQSCWAAHETALEIGRFRVLPRRRQVIADGVPVKLGTRVLDLLLVLMEAEGSLVTKRSFLPACGPAFMSQTRT
jgi:hypothetical protein